MTQATAKVSRAETKATAAKGQARANSKSKPCLSPPNTPKPVGKKSSSRRRDREVSLGTSETTLHNSTEVAKCPLPFCTVPVFPILPTIRLEPSLTHVLCGIGGVALKTKTVTSILIFKNRTTWRANIRSPSEDKHVGTNISGSPMVSPNSALVKEPSNAQRQVHSNKGLEEVKNSSSPVSSATPRVFDDSVVAYHSTPRRLHQNPKGASNIALTSTLSSVEHEFHDKRVLDKFEASNRGTSSRTKTSEHALPSSKVVSSSPSRHVLIPHSAFCVHLMFFRRQGPSMCKFQTNLEINHAKRQVPIQFYQVRGRSYVLTYVLLLQAPM